MSGPTFVSKEPALAAVSDWEESCTWVNGKRLRKRWEFGELVYSHEWPLWRRLLARLRGQRP
jgi:hypothetical protein